MKFKLEITCDNAAFEDRELEVARILRDLADELDECREDGFVRDGNGNTCGKWGFYGRVTA